jgi:C4-dicarboxylate-specific signal transduction histidine kinase
VGVAADTAQVHVGVSKLVVKAIDALSGTQAPRVTVTVGAKDGMAELRVADNGPGVAAGVRAKLFEPFVTGKPSGVGIGLALARRIARAHGGDLVLEPGAAGASFLFSLPTTEEST